MWLSLWSEVLTVNCSKCYACVRSRLLLQFVLTENCLSFPCSEKSPSIPGQVLLRCGRPAQRERYTIVSVCVCLSVRHKSLFRPLLANKTEATGVVVIARK